MIINLTQHPATPEQIAAGVVDLDTHLFEELQSALTFDALPNANDIERAAGFVASIAAEFAVHNWRGQAGKMVTWRHNYVAALMPAFDYCGSAVLEKEINSTLEIRAMIGGAPYLMAPLERALFACGITPVYAFSRRVSEEQAQPDGSVRKVNTFKHEGFVPCSPQQ